MSLASNTRHLLRTASGEEAPEHASVEYHLLSWRELYDQSIVSADRYSSSAGEWVIWGDRHFYTVTVTTRPVYILPQELCLFFDCFTETKVSTGGGSTIIGPPIDQVAFEFMTLISVFIREPLVPLGVRRINDRPVVESYHYVPPPRLNRTPPPPAAAVNSIEFVSILKGLAQAPQATIDSALAATQLYYEGLALVGFDPSGAYVSLVSAIECLAGHYYKERVFDFETVEKFRNAQPFLDSIGNLPNGKALADALKQELVRSEHFLFQKFALLIADHLPDEFWKTKDELYPYSSVFPPIDQKDLRTGPSQDVSGTGIVDLS
jgi:hypothetical protein